MPRQIMKRFFITKKSNPHIFYFKQTIDCISQAFLNYFFIVLFSLYESDDGHFFANGSYCRCPKAK